MYRISVLAQPATNQFPTANSRRAFCFRRLSEIRCCLASAGLALQRLWLREVVTPLRITTLNAFGITTREDISEFAMRSKLKDRDRIVTDGWIHPGAYCPNGDYSVLYIIKRP